MATFTRIGIVAQARESHKKPSPASSRLGTRALLAILLLALLIVSSALVYFQTGMGVKREIISDSTHSFSGDSQVVRVLIGRFDDNLGNRNIGGVLAFYSPDSTIIWTGTTEGLGGNYRGQEKIGNLFNTFISLADSLNASVSNFTTTVVSPSTVNATYVLTITGVGTSAGNFGATVVVKQQWVQGSQAWVIQKDTWNFTDFSTQYLHY